MVFLIYVIFERLSSLNRISFKFQSYYSSLSSLSCALFVVVASAEYCQPPLPGCYIWPLPLSSRFFFRNKYFLAYGSLAT